MNWFEILPTFIVVPVIKKFLSGFHVESDSGHGVVSLLEMSIVGTDCAIQFQDI